MNAPKVEAIRLRDTIGTPVSSEIAYRYTKLDHTMWLKFSDWSEVQIGGWAGSLAWLTDVNLDTTYSGWYLPTNAELTDMYHNLFLMHWNSPWFIQDYYRSSTEYDDENAYTYWFNWDWLTPQIKDSVAYVRPCRVFTSPPIYAIWDQSPSGWWIYKIIANAHYECAPVDIPMNIWSANYNTLWTIDWYGNWPANTLTISTDSINNCELDCLAYAAWLADNNLLSYDLTTSKRVNIVNNFDFVKVYSKQYVAGRTALTRSMWNFFYLDATNNVFEVALWIPADNEKVTIYNSCLWIYNWLVAVYDYFWNLRDYIASHQSRTYIWKGWVWMQTSTNEFETHWNYWAGANNQVHGTKATWVGVGVQTNGDQSTAFWYTATAFAVTSTAIGAYSYANWIKSTVIWNTAKDNSLWYSTTIWAGSANRAWYWGIRWWNDQLAENKYGCATNERHWEVTSASATEIFLIGNSAWAARWYTNFINSITWVDMFAIAKNADSTLCKTWRLTGSISRSWTTTARFVWWALNKEVLAFDAWTETWDINPTLSLSNLLMMVTWTNVAIRWRVQATMPHILAVT